jgi:hypothetical protein
MKLISCIFACMMAWSVTATAGTADHSLPGTLFYTPQQRAMLVNAREHKVTELQKSSAPPNTGPVSFDGTLTRSDGVGTHWINGLAHVGQSSTDVRNLKPGQIRAGKKVYEPYQLIRRGESLTSPVTEHNEVAR